MLSKFNQVTLKEKSLHEEIDEDGRTILERIFKKQVPIRRIGLIRLRIVLECPCECGIIPPGFISHGVIGIIGGTLNIIYISRPIFIRIRRNK